MPPKRLRMKSAPGFNSTTTSGRPRACRKVDVSMCPRRSSGPFEIQRIKVSFPAENSAAHGIAMAADVRECTTTSALRAGGNKNGSALANSPSEPEEMSSPTPRKEALLSETEQLLCGTAYYF
jgi:hypothetical protein